MNISEALEEFVRERKSYFERAESEVVQLALAIARKILHRESQIDPLFLTGIVRVALEKVAATSSVKLRVSENDVFKWRQIAAAGIDASLKANLKKQPRRWLQNLPDLGRTGSTRPFREVFLR